MEIGIDSFAIIKSPLGKESVQPARFAHELVDEIELADQAGVDVYGVGEHHREEFLDSAAPVILGAAAARTKKIRLTSAVTVLSAADPVRVFEEYATLDLLSNGRAEIVAGRGSLVEAFPLFGYDLEDYDELFEEKLELLLKIREQPYVHWSGKHRPALTGQGVFPRPVQNPLPVWVGAGGSPESFERAGRLGLPLMVAIIGGNPLRFRPLVERYRQVGEKAGHAPEKLKVGLHLLGYVGKTDRQAAEDHFPGYAKTMTEFGRERGWPAMTRSHYDASRGPEGNLLVGGPERVAERILRLDEAFGGLSRVTFQMSAADMPHEKLMAATELLGAKVAPQVRARPAQVRTSH